MAHLPGNSKFNFCSLKTLDHAWFWGTLRVSLEHNSLFCLGSVTKLMVSIVTTTDEGFYH